MNDVNILQKIILDEIAGKNQAIHAYDKILWTVRAGFLTLFFGGWSLFVKSIIERSAKGTLDINRLLIVMMLLSVALSIGGIFVDRNYVRRKFRVIYALDNILAMVVKRGDEVVRFVDDLQPFVQVSGDKKNETYLCVLGYWPEWGTGLMIYLLSMLVAIFSVGLLWNLK